MLYGSEDNLYQFNDYTLYMINIVLRQALIISSKARPLMCSMKRKKTNELYTTITRLIIALFEMAPELDFIDQSERRTSLV